MPRFNQSINQSSVCFLPPWPKELLFVWFILARAEIRCVFGAEESRGMDRFPIEGTSLDWFSPRMYRRDGITLCREKACILFLESGSVLHYFCVGRGLFPLYRGDTLSPRCKTGVSLFST